MANGSVQGQLDSLSPRDRKLLAGLFVVIAVAFVAFLTITLRSSIADKTSRVVAQKESLITLQEMQTEYLAAQAQIEAAQVKAKEFAGKPLPAYLEETATKVGVRENFTVATQGTEDDEGVRTTRYRVELQKVSYDLALNFIYDIETGGYPLVVESATFKSKDYKATQEMNVTLEIATFAVKEEGA